MLVAISIPIFSNQLEKSRESTDAANIRNEYALIMTEILENPDTAIPDTDHTISLQQGTDGWQNTTTSASLTSLAKTAAAGSGDTAVVVTGSPTDGGSCKIKYDPSTPTAAATVTITLN